MPKRKSTDPSAQMDTENDGSTALRRKRRSSAGPADPPAKKTHTRKHEADTTSESSVATNVTPAGAEKHVRFSNSDPDGIASSSSVTVTQTTQQTSLVPASQSTSPASPRLHTKSPNQRASLPLSQSSLPSSGELQFAPLKDVVDGRAKRRLRRNHLSEEINEIDAEKRESARNRHEIEELKHEVHDVERKIQDLEHELELEKQRGSEIEADHEDAYKAAERVRDLEEELIMVREQARERTESPAYPNLEDYNRGMVGYGTTDQGPPDDGMIINPEYDIVKEPTLRMLPLVGSEVRPTEPINHVALLDLDHEATIKGLEHKIISLDAKIQHWLLSYQSWLLKLEPYTLPPTTTNAEEKMDHAVDGVLSRLVATEIRAGDAEAALQALGDEIRNLGFEGEGVEEIISIMGEQFRQTRLALEYLAPGETPYGFDNSKLLQVLVDRVRLLVEQVKAGETNLQSQRHELAALRKQFNVTLQTLGDTCGSLKEVKSQVESKTSSLTNAEKRIKELEAELGERERSVSKLQQALEGYRTEVSNLESLITKLETDHHAALAKLQRETGETISDLECQVAAETKGRQSAEAMTVERNNAVASLERRLVEAQANAENVRAEMQALLIIKETEIAAEMQARQISENATADRNKMIAELEANLAAANAYAEDVRAEMQAVLVDKEYKLAEASQGRRAAETVAAEREEDIGQLEEKLKAVQKNGEDVSAKLQALLADTERKLAQEVEARQAGEAAIKKKTQSIAQLEKKLVGAKKQSEDVRKEMEALLAQKNVALLALEQAGLQKDQLHEEKLESKNRLVDALNLEVSNLISALTESNAKVAILQTTNTALEVRVTEEIENGIRAVELMQAEMMRSLGRVSEVKNSYVRRTKVKSVRGMIAGEEVAEVERPLTPRNTVRFTDVEITSSGKRQHKVSRMNGDSGVGIMEEDFEEEEEGQMVRA